MCPDTLLPPSIYGETSPNALQQPSGGPLPLPAGSVGTGGEQRVPVRWGTGSLPGGWCGGSGAARAAAAFPQHHQPASPLRRSRGCSRGCNEPLNKPPGR